MPFAHEALASDLDYMIWADRLALDACAQLTPEELGRDLGCSHRNLAWTLFHFYDGERFWLECLHTQSLPPMDSPGSTTYPNEPAAEIVASLQQTWPRLHDDLLIWFAPLSEGDLSGQLTSHMPRGDRQFTRWQILRHVINHSTLHRGQIITMLRMLGHQPPQTDLLTFYLEQ